MLWFKFILILNSIFLCFELIIIHYHTPKHRTIKLEPRIKLNHNNTLIALRTDGHFPGGNSLMNGAGMFFLSTRGVNFGFWSHLGCSGQNAIIFSRKGLFKGCTRRNIKKLCIFNSFYLLDSCNQRLKWSVLGVKNRLIGLL